MVLVNTVPKTLSVLNYIRLNHPLNCEKDVKTQGYL